MTNSPTNTTQTQQQAVVVAVPPLPGSSSSSPTTATTTQLAAADKEPFNWFRAIVSIILLLAYLVVWITSIISVSLPIATFHYAPSTYYMSLWTNCTLGAPDRCKSLEFFCDRSRARFDTARAFGILSILISFYCIVSVSIALVQLIRSSDVEAAAKAIRSCIYAGLCVLICSIISLALSIVISVEPLCEGFDSLKETASWQIGTGVEASAAQSAFALVATCFGRIMEKRISTSKLGVE